MDYGIVGLGPVGATFAAHLQQAGHKVSSLEIEVEKVEWLRKHPVSVSGELKATAQLSNIHSNPQGFVRENPDVVLICTKACHSLEALRNIKECDVKDTTLFVSCQNGIGVEEQISEVFGEHRALRMVLNWGCNWISRSAVEIVWSFEHFLSKLEANPSMSEAIGRDLDRAGIKNKVVGNYREEAFKKGVLNSALGTVCALTRQTMKDAMSEPDILEMVKEIVRESIEIGRAIGLSIGPDYLDVAISYLSRGGHHKPSILVDIEHRRLTENEYHCGTLFRYARQRGVEAPVIQTLYHLVKNLERTVLEPGSHT